MTSRLFSRRQLLLACIATPLAGCGYQLRGLHQAQSLPYQKVYVRNQGADAEVVRQLTQVLFAFGAQLVTEANQAEIEILLTASEYQSVASAIGDHGEISARLMVLTQGLKVKRSDATDWLIDTRIRRTREVDQASTILTTLGAERPLAITRESEEVMQDVRARVVDAIIRIVQRLSPLDNPAS